MNVKFTIIGGGVIGCAIAYELSKTLDDIVLLEKDSRIPGDNQSSRNSGVIHAGVYYDPEFSPLKAALTPRGVELLYAFCSANGVPYKKIGKLIVANSDQEEEYLEDTLRIARLNCVPGVELISSARSKDLDPSVSCTSALYVPSSGIVDAATFVGTLANLAKRNRVDFLLKNEVREIRFVDGCFKVRLSSGEEFDSEHVINAAGLYADDIARMINPTSAYKIKPTRGESARLYRNERLPFRGLNIYPVPYGYYLDTGERARVPVRDFYDLLRQGKVGRTIGIHLTPTLGLDGELSSLVTIGPAKTIVKRKDDYGDKLKPETHYYYAVRDFFQGLSLADISLHQAGIMAVGGNDWIIERDPQHDRFLNLIGMDSPALTASLAIAEYVKSMITR